MDAFSPTALRAEGFEASESVAAPIEAPVVSRGRIESSPFYKPFVLEEAAPVWSESWSLLDAANFTTRVELRIKPVPVAEPAEE